MSSEILQYIPHREKMVLIDTIVDKSRENFIVEVKTSSRSLLSTPEGIPAFCAIEYMAQSIAAYNKIYAMGGVESVEPRIGFIIAIRKFESELKFIPLDKSLFVKVEPILVVNNSGSFTCYIEMDSKVIASAKITAYEPSDEELEKFKRDANE